MRLDDTVSCWMSDRPLTLRPDQSVWEAHCLLAQKGFHHLPIVSVGRLVGIVSDRDIAGHIQAAMARDDGSMRSLLALSIADVMRTDGMATADPMTTIARAADVMLEKSISSLPVIDPISGKLVGIVTSHDLLRALTTRVAAR